MSTSSFPTKGNGALSAASIMAPKRAKLVKAFPQ